MHKGGKSELMHVIQPYNKENIMSIYNIATFGVCFFCLFGFFLVFFYTICWWKKKRKKKQTKKTLVQSRLSSGGVTTGPLQMRMSASVYV